MRFSLHTLAFAVLILLAATPVSSARRSATSFRIQFEVTRSKTFDTGYYTGTFHATGAILDSGSALTRSWPWTYSTLLRGKKGDLGVGITPSGDGRTGTFTIQGSGEAYSGISGSGTATRTFVSRQKSETVRWQLEGTLIAQ